AGFASGQELMQFFAAYGSLGLAGVILSGLLFAWLGQLIMAYSRRMHAASYQELIYHSCGSKIGFCLDALITLLLFGILTIMLAGTGTLCQESLGYPYLCGLFVLSLAAGCTVYHGMKGLAAVSLLATPLLVLSTMAVSLYSLCYHGLTYDFLPTNHWLSLQPAPHWLMASLLYVSYNLTLGMTVLTPLGSLIPSRQARLWGSIIGGMLLAMLAAVITIVLLLHDPDITNCEIPLLYIAGQQHAGATIAFLSMFFIAMYTTAAAALYGCSTKLKTATGLSLASCIVIVLLFSSLCSQWGFSTLIAAIFPCFGYITLLFLLRLIYLRLVSR
ncbi:MAG: hypothetical protein LLG02_15810, partial [Pelosinus sp.]|nr:hypothetical protein [Pelosinus sp.]